METPPHCRPGNDHPGALERDKELAFQAVFNDPTTNLPIDRAWEMFEEIGLPESWFVFALLGWIETRVRNRVLRKKPGFRLLAGAHFLNPAPGILRVPSRLNRNHEFGQGKPC